MSSKLHPLLLVTFILHTVSLQTAFASSQVSLVKDINPSVDDTIGASITLTQKNINSILPFYGSNRTDGERLWVSDGTEAGTNVFPSRNFKPSIPIGSKRSLVINNIFYTGAHSDQTTPEMIANNIRKYDLVAVDLTTKTHIILGTFFGKSVGRVPRPVSGHSNPFFDFTNVNGRLYFNVWDEQYGYEIWKTEGTPESTSLVKDVIPGVNRIIKLKNLTAINDTLYFTYEGKLWKSDGTNAGTVPIQADFKSIRGSLVNFKGSLFFLAVDKDFNGKLWKTDGTEAGTVPVKSGQGLVGLSIKKAQGRQSMVVVNDTLFFISRNVTSYDLWKTDGTEAGTIHLVANAEYPGLARNRQSPFSKLTNVNGTLFFVFHDNINGKELWKSDGTIAGTKLVKDINPGTSDSHPSYLTDLENTLFFTAIDGVHGGELWKSDGTDAGTQLVHDINPGTTSSFIQNIINVNNTLFFTANDGVHGSELWTLKNEPVIGASAPINCEAGFDPQTIKPGEGTALWWWSANAASASISNGIGDVTVPRGFLWISPEKSTTYTVTAKTPNGTATTCEATLTVESVTAAPLTPICEMGADPQVISAGEGTALWWWTNNTNSASISTRSRNPSAAVSVILAPLPSNYVWFNPTQTETYIMKAIGADGVESICKTTITVN
ncbi:MAG: hypothetical protein KAH20_11465 [Methylococcales bacterium]|nr:hypothetical protein [Methylococcales bacterium]